MEIIRNSGLGIKKRNGKDWSEESLRRIEKNRGFIELEVGIDQQKTKFEWN